MSINDGIPTDDNQASVIRDGNMYALLQSRKDKDGMSESAGKEHRQPSTFHGIATAFCDGFDKAYYGRPRSEQVADAAGQVLGKAAKHADKVVPVVIVAVAVIAGKRAIKKAIFG